MKNIKVKVLSCKETIKEIEEMGCLAARLTQRGHQIKNIDDLLDLKSIYSDDEKREKLLSNLIKLPHPTLQKLGKINIVIVGASRRFLAQITRHQNEVKFMSASLQYSDYSGVADFVVPISIEKMGKEIKEAYLDECKRNADTYQELIQNGISNDDAGYIMPQSLRNVLIISATPYEFKHMIRQRICKRNSEETKFVMLKVWEALNEASPILFSDCMPECYKRKCPEGKMSCGKPFETNSIKGILKEEFGEI